MKGDIDSPHWDGKGALRRRFEDEIADVLAACALNVDKHCLDEDYILDRAAMKLAMFRGWDAERP